jgi:penicillin-binding protein 2
MTTAKRDLFEIFTRRAVLLSFGGAGAVAAIGARLAWLQAEDAFDREYTLAAKSNRFDLRPIVPPRGVIYDRFGDALALASKDYRVTIVPEEAEDLEATLRALGDLLAMSPETVARRIRDVRNRRPFDEVLIKNGLEWPQFAAVNVRLPELKGVRAEVGEQRYYPYKSAFAHPIGYVQKPNQDEIDKVEAADREAAGLPAKAQPGERFDSPRARYLRNPDVRVGKAGVEAALEPELQGEPGWLQVEVNASGRVVSELSKEAKPAVQGAGIVLTLDAELQRLAMERMAGQSGAAVVMDVTNGDVLVMASAPGFDPNDFVNGISYAEFKDLSEWNHKPLFHKAVSGTYSPGSTMKPTSGLAVQAAGIDPKERVHCPGYLWYGGRAFHCWQHSGHGFVDLRDAIKHSCDVYFYTMSIRVGQQLLADTARLVGFGQKFDVSLPAVSAGVVPDRAWWTKRRPNDPWPAGMTLNTVIGQGDMLASPLQLCVVAARIATRGKAVMPRLVRDGPGVAPPGPFAQVPIPQEHFDRVIDAMIAVCNEPGGTATRAGNLRIVRDPATGKALDIATAPRGLQPVRMGGKTGSAQVRTISAAERARGVRQGDAIDWELRDNALFICFAPAEAPRYVCSVVIEHAEHGSSAAAPIASDIMRAVLMRDPGDLPTMTIARTTAYSPNDGDPA